MKVKEENKLLGKELLNSSSAAKMAGVTPSTIKRWADEGRLTCERTAGGHRRFRKSTLVAFIKDQQFKGRDADAVQKWVSELVTGSHYSAVSELYRLRKETGCWAKTADALEPIIEGIGESWANGSLSIAEEHRASECLSRAIWQVGNSLPSIDSPPIALLATAEGDQHALGLRLAEMCLLNRQWRTVWIGPNTPTNVLMEHLEKEKVDLLLISASPWILSEETLEKIAVKLSDHCQRQGVDLIFGGRGKWPELNYGLRVSSFEDFDQLLQAKQS